jgi:hypothetical protein
LGEWFRGEESDAAMAAGCNFAEVLLMIRGALSAKE